MAQQQPMQHHGQRWSGIIGTGQSLGCGIQAPLPGMTQPVPHALKLNDPTDPWHHKYNIDRPDDPKLKVVPLNEPIHAIHPDAKPPGAYPWNIAGKTPHSSMAAQVTSMLQAQGRAPSTTVHTNVARSGEPMFRINKGGETNCYRASMYEAKALTRIAHQQGARLEYDALIMTHGETDAGFGNNEYEDMLLKFHRDYVQDLRAITGQRHAPIMIQSQQATCPTDCKDMRPSPVTQAQWRAQLRNPDIICIGPRYQYGYHPDGLHFIGPSYDRLGEKYGQAYHQTLIEGRPFVPLSPKQISLEQPQTIHVSFNVPVPPLRWDESLWQPHTNMYRQWARGRGFEVRDSHGRAVEIAGVQTNQDAVSVLIQLASVPDHFPLCVAYAMCIDKDNCNGGRPGGRVGHLCDSDTTIGASAERIRVRVQHGSNKVEGSHESFARRAPYDLIEGGQYTIMTFQDGRRCAVLDRPWNGPSGEQELFFQHNHRNYLVAFASWVRAEGFTYYAKEAQSWPKGGSSAGSGGFPGSSGGGHGDGHGGGHGGGFKDRLHGLFRG